MRDLAPKLAKNVRSFFARGVTLADARKVGEATADEIKQKSAADKRRSHGSRQETEEYLTGLTGSTGFQIPILSKISAILICVICVHPWQICDFSREVHQGLRVTPGYSLLPLTGLKAVSLSDPRDLRSSAADL
ncbi:hypothetical protein [Gemmata massiliana]|uniref:hypothetical protein n=1 Tax=Gemmata massiliana TaxID=1210884 RepID=UPI0013A69956|nr:hypothetical protein [Gemmata massiliana]